ncbi:MAG: hypothetical protein M3Q56_02170 [Bacteroidota bacterium]|nr:hypothetical protein [Bacteroidota bacterium]
MIFSTGHKNTNKKNKFFQIYSIQLVRILGSLSFTVLFLILGKTSVINSSKIVTETHGSDTLTALVEKIKQQIGQIDKDLQLQKDQWNTLKTITPKNSNTTKELEDIQKSMLALNVKLDGYRALLTECFQLQHKSTSKIYKNIPAINKKFTELKNMVVPSNLIYTERWIPSASSIENADFQIESPCQLEYSSDLKIKANSFTLLFSYTDPKIEAYFIDKEFLYCYSRFLTQEKSFFLELKLIFTSPMAKNIYGNFDISDPVKLRFINQDFIYLKSMTNVSGEPEAKTGHIIYRIQFALDKHQLKKIKKNELDLISFLWKNKLEEFELTKLDLMQNHLECLQTKN